MGAAGVPWGVEARSLALRSPSLLRPAAAQLEGKAGTTSNGLRLSGSPVDRCAGGLVTGFLW